MAAIIPLRMGGNNVRWDLIEDLCRSYMVGLCDEDRSDWFEQQAALTASEQEALKWEIERRDRAIGQLLGVLKNQGADCVADLVPDSGPEAA